MGQPILKTSTSRGIIFQFESQSDITEYTDGSKFEMEDSAFVGEEFESWEQVQAKSKSVWDAGMETLAMFVERLRKSEIPDIKSHKRKIVWGPTGDECDLDKLLAGDPNCWKSYVREETSGPTTLTILIDTTTPGSMQSDDILWRGAAAIALTHILEEKGYSVELWVVNGSKLFESRSEPVMTACCLKRTSDPLDSATLVNTVAGWFYRTVIFTLLKTICKKTGNRVAYGLGGAYSPVEADLDQITPDALRIYSSGVFSFNGAINLMEHELKKIADAQPV